MTADVQQPPRSRGAIALGTTGTAAQAGRFGVLLGGTGRRGLDGGVAGVAFIRQADAFIEPVAEIDQLTTLAAKRWRRRVLQKKTPATRRTGHRGQFRLTIGIGLHDHSGFVRTGR